MLPDLLMAPTLSNLRNSAFATFAFACALAIQGVAVGTVAADDSVCSNGDILVSASVHSMSELPPETIASMMEWSAAFNLSEFNMLELEAQNPSNEDAHEISWCTSPNDPKCSPLLPENNPITRTLVGSYVAATVPAISDIAASPSVTFEFAPATVEVGAGYRERLDRPPEA